MKTRERLERIKESKSWTERLELARDHIPGTWFDAHIKMLLDTLQSCELHPPQKRKYFSAQTGVDLAALNADTFAAFGADMAQAIQNGNSDLFREWADAVDAWHRHKPFADKLRATMIRICVPPNEVFKRSWINTRLKNYGFDPDADTVFRQVTRILSELKIKTDGKTRQNPEDTKPRKSRL
jgi:hypothetical protein